MAVARKKVSIPTLEERVECLMAELEDALEALAAEQARRHAAGRDPAHDECPRVRRLSLPFLPRGYEGKPRFETGNKLSGGRPRGSRNRLAGRVVQDVLEFWNEPATEDGTLTQARRSC
jgi:hypothetical protein